MTKKSGGPWSFHLHRRFSVVVIAKEGGGAMESLQACYGDQRNVPKNEAKEEGYRFNFIPVCTALFAPSFVDDGIFR